MKRIPFLGSRFTTVTQALLLLALGFLLSTNQLSAAPAGVVAPSQLTILGVEPDFASGTLLLSGRNFGGSTFIGTATLFVPTLGEVNLPVGGYNENALGGAQELLVGLPEVLTNFTGIFVLKVATGTGASQIGTFDVTLSPNVPRFNAHQTFTGSNVFTGVVTMTNPTNVFVGTFFGDGSGLTNLNVTGTPGPIGPQGPIGLTGLMGPQGLQGLIGPIGLTGPAGPQGIAGTNGLDGATGPAGPQGPIGLTGPQGLQGLTGLTGATGPQGPQGLQGLIGPIGLTGPAGPQGPAGMNGLDGAQGPGGPQGARGLTFLGAWSGTSNYVAADAVAFNGSSWLAKQANNNVSPVEGADWTLLSAKGDAGDTGPQGVQGPQGPMGFTGATGPQGPVGPEGQQGPEGSPGTTTADGITSGILADEHLSPNVALLDTAQTFSATHGFAGGIHLNSSDLQLKGPSDQNHGLGWHGGTKLFANADVGGPVLWGATGGALGSRQTGNLLENLALRWFDDQSVQVLGNLSVDGTISGNFDASQITSGILDGSRIADDSITTSKIANQAVGTSQLAADSVGTVKLKDGAVTDAKITAVNASKLTGTIDNARISLTATEIPSLDASKITSGTLADARLSGNIPILDAAQNLFTGNIRMADTDFLLRGDTAVTVGLGWRGSGKAFASDETVNGPVLWGRDGGALGSRINGVEKFALRWFDSPLRVEIPGDLSIGGNLSVNLNASSITSGTIDNARISLTAAEIPSLDASKITSGTFTAARIPNLDASKITTGQFNSARIADGAVTAGKVGYQAVTSSNLAPASVTDAKISDVSASKITGTISTSQIADDSINNPKLKDSSVSNAKIANGAVTDAKIASVDASKLTGAITVDGLGRMGLNQSYGNITFNVRKVGGSSDETIFQVEGGDGTDLFWVQQNGDSYCRNNIHADDLFINSDQRLKNSITALGETLSRVMQLRPVTYRLNKDGLEDPQHIGFIAQEVQPLFPETVSTNGEYLAIGYGAFGPIAIKAIQEQQAQLDAKETRIKSLEERLSVLETLIEQLTTPQN